MKRNFTYTLVLVTTLLTSSCRKEIVHQVGILNLPLEVVDRGQAWEEVSGTATSLTCLQAYKDKLYIGSADEEHDYKHVMSWDGNLLSNVLPGYMFSFGVFDLHVHDSKLYIGGEYYHYKGSSEATNLMAYNGSTFQPFTFGTQYTSEIKGMISFKGDLLVRGYFRTSHDNIKTNYLERVTSSIVGFNNGVSEEINDFVEYNDKLYIAGDGEFENNVYMLGFWNGSLWQNSGAETKGSMDDGWSVEVYQNKLYFSHNKSWATNSTFLRTYDGSSWSNVPEIDVASTNKTFLKQRGDNLYFFGNGILLDEENNSNIIRFDGTKWTAIGHLNYPIVDIEIYDNYIYAATTQGLFRYKL